MRNIEQRLAKIEAQVDTHDPALRWSAVQAALQRQHARGRLTICRLLGIDPDDRRMREAAVLLTDDSPASTTADTALIAQWHGHLGILAARGEARARVTERLETMARRLRDADRSK